MLTDVYRTAFLNDGLAGLLIAAGGSLKVRLLRNSAEISGNGYSRATVASIADGTTVGEASEAIIPVSFQAVGGSYQFDQVEVLNGAGSNRVDISALFDVVTISSGETLAMDIQISVADRAIQILEKLFDKVVNFGEYGRPNDPGFDNNTIIEQLVADGFKSFYIGAGDWYTNGPLDLTNPNFDNVRFFGAGSEFAAQHQEEGSQGNKQLSRFIHQMSNDSDIWWDHKRPYRFGIIEFRNLTFQVPTKGSVFSFGDMTNLDTGAASLRGLVIEHCYGTFLNYAGNHLIDNGVNGFTINRTNTNFFIRIHQGYDVVLRDIACRGFYTNVILSHCDRPVLDNVRGLVHYKHIDSFGIPNGQAPVAGHLDNIFCEAPFLVGCTLQHQQVSKLRMESGYNASLTPNPGIYTLPASVTWNIAAPAPPVGQPAEPVVGADRMILSGFAGGFNATHYFEPRTVIRIQPTQANEPYRDLFITSVSATEVFFANSTSTCFVHRAISGPGTSISRYFPQSIILMGDGSEMTQPNLALNETIPDFPLLWIVPTRKPIRVGGNLGGLNLSELTLDPVVVAACAGIQVGLQAGVDFLGSEDCPNHPLVNKGGIGPKYDPNWREAIYDEATDKQIFLPGRGVTSEDDNARDLMFRQVLQDGRLVWCYKLDDSPNIGWKLRLLKSAVSAVYEIHCYAPTTGLGLNIYGGNGSANTPSLAQGWQVITGTLTGVTQLAANIMYVGGTNVYCKKIKIFQA